MKYGIESLIKSFTDRGMPYKRAQKRVRKTMRMILDAENRASRNGGKNDPYAVSLLEAPRRRVDEDGEGWREYGIYSLTEEQKSMSDKELGEEIREYFRIPFQHEAWDCTGKPFTMWIDWHRNPCGFVSVIHRVGIDC